MRTGKKGTFQFAENPEIDAEEAARAQKEMITQLFGSLAGTLAAIPQIKERQLAR
ncbi:MAG: hypothetical protein HY901_11080 [Deltaproteobacteria bacterium]|nr:hypothetical protein [Deltaproteobacteria bacterium]